MLNPTMLRNLCRVALAEDIGSGDATTLSVVPADLQVAAKMVTRQDCVVAGLPLAEALFHELDPTLCFAACVEDGTRCGKGQVLAWISGSAQSILTGERTALNFVQRYSGIATQTRAYVDALGDATTRVLDTRKTTPGLRTLEKYAVKMGGGTNHRFGLYDRVMIKDNHRELAKLSGPDSIQRAVAACREKFPALEVEVEADTLDEVRAALEAKAEYILLDNMTNEQMAEAVALADGCPSRLEASGNVTLERIPSLATLGLDFISVGALTHSVPAVDIGLDIDPVE
ncbi:MAG: carboxylating nicotinate-nucleotide diphosphorylase [Victivallales bacterium]|jgi:nicotinate-nucleotide pyrophosphorylase (carboxylating)|nr:carboxylating nicotinate-nucleotide diphosphorylase [Victivallales bacterium]MBT7303562.1 carboxylating nicotinate-nucleotide diphosphorylase [Victivallales bacterium]